MRTDSDIFDEAVRNRALGRRIPDHAGERGDGGLQRYVDHAQEQIELFRRSDLASVERPLPRIVIDFTDSTSVNACAFQSDSTFIVAISIGVINTLYYMFSRLLSDKTILPEIGDVRNERDNLPMCRVSTDWKDLAASIRTAGLSFADFIPRDPIRSDVARFMINEAVLFLVGHELRHIQAGHIQYADDVLALSSLSELGLITNGAELGLRQQALEIDADNFALHGTLTIASHMLENPHLLDTTLSNIAMYKEKLMEISILSCSGLFRVLDAYDKPDPARWSELSHPPSRVRRLMISAHAETYLDQEKKRGLFCYPNVTSRDNQMLIERHVENVWGSPYDEGYSRLSLLEAPAHISKIKGAAKAMGADLKKYSYTPFRENYYF